MATPAHDRIEGQLAAILPPNRWRRRPPQASETSIPDSVLGEREASLVNRSIV
jgi:hypothetical protein